MTTSRIISWVIIAIQMTYWITVAVGGVGTIPERATEPMTWWWPIQLFIFTGSLVTSGYFAGYRDARAKDACNDQQKQ